MRSVSNLALRLTRLIQSHGFLLSGLFFTITMQSIMWLLAEIGSQIMAQGFDQSQWVYHRSGVLVETIPTAVFWHYIQQHYVQISRGFGGWVILLLGLQLPLVVMYLGLARWRRWQRYFTLMLWAWPIATPFVGFAIYCSQTPTWQRFLRYLGIGIGFVGLGIFAVAPQGVIRSIGYFLAFLLAAVFFMLGGMTLALTYTFTVLSGHIGMSGEMEREGLSYGLAVLGYFELFWFGLFLTQYFRRLNL
jgi:hypothetical protein